MTALQVTGRDPAKEAYRVRARISGKDVVALVPECLMDSLRPGERPSHQEAYEWIARHAAPLNKAITSRLARRVPATPYDLVTLAEENANAH